ncbi:hypothetical protein CDL12_16806 [Handroanthus impetiginosus]|uniref:TF-B3 domain-containing protein n=1 Tax=Handroanthus impetiginosus TaxID=429701 RepID=A0A2G9GZE9_9LAMI|nr:hypothetical protein CDL12_16806 [Handroanthus impetiginosus]
MKKTFYHSFITLKEEEQAPNSNTNQYQPPRVLIEIRDIYPYSTQSQWQIKKILTHHEVAIGKLLLPFSDMFEHVFRYWNIFMANHVVLGYKVNVIIWDVTDQKMNNNPTRYRGEGFYVEMLPNDDYTLTCMELFKDRNLSVDDEIGLCWDPRGSSFQFTLFCKTLN